MKNGNLEEESVCVRKLRPADLAAVIELDGKVTGERRSEFFRHKLEQGLADTGIQLSLAAEVEGVFAGFLLGRVYYGEFGRMEQVAVLDSIGVHPDFQGRGVGRAMLCQLRQNLHALGLTALQTEVGWESQDLLAFFHREGFMPAPRFLLQFDLTQWRGDPSQQEG